MTMTRLLTLVNVLIGRFWLFEYCIALFPWYYFLAECKDQLFCLRWAIQMSFKIHCIAFWKTVQTSEWSAEWYFGNFFIFLLKIKETWYYWKEYKRTATLKLFIIDILTYPSNLSSVLRLEICSSSIIWNLFIWFRKQKMLLL
jgi:hypothetical protein